MEKTLKHAKYAAALVLLLTIPTVIYPQKGTAGFALTLLYFAAGAVVYFGYAHAGKKTGNKLLKNTATMMIGYMLLFALLSTIQQTPYRISEENVPEEIILAMMALQTIYGLAMIGLGKSLFPLKEKIGKAATATAILYTTTGLLYTTAWILAAGIRVTDILPEESGALSSIALMTTSIISVAAQAATIIFFWKAEKKLG